MRTVPRRDPERLRAWESRAELPLLVLAVAFLVVFLVPLYSPRLPAAAGPALFAVNVVVWVAFAADYLVRLRLAPDRRRFVRRHAGDVLILAVPVLRPLRLLRLVGVLVTANRRVASRRLLGTTAYVVGAVGVLVVVSAGLLLDVERDAPGANVRTAGDALWWAAATVTTVGYGDRYPVTTEGRLVALALMTGGIALLGVVTAGIAAWFVDRLQEAEDVVEVEVGETAVGLADVLAELRALRGEVAALREVGAGRAPGG